MKPQPRHIIIALAASSALLISTLLLGSDSSIWPLLGLIYFVCILGLLLWQSQIHKAELQTALLTIETYLKSVVGNQGTRPLTLPGAWDDVVKTIKSIQTYLKVSTQSLEDRATLYQEIEQKLEESEQKLEASQHQILEKEEHLRQNEQKLQRSEYKVLEYALALQHINLIQRKIQGQLSIGPLLTEATQLLVFHLCAHRGVFLRTDMLNQSVQAMSPVNCPFEENQILSMEGLLPILQQYGLDHPPNNESQDGNIRIIRLTPEQSPFYEMEFMSALLVPVWVDRDLWGMFCLIDKEERMSLITGQPSFTNFSESDELILRNVVAFLQKDLRNAYLFEMATIDSLSQLYVRRYFENRLRDEIRRAKRHPAVFSLLLLDIDHFKSVNDTYGHLVGDIVIRKVADVVRNSLRQGLDLPARYGGEELIVLLPNTPLEGAVLVAERIRKTIGQLVFDEMNNTRPQPHVTISIGVSSFPNHGNDYKPLVEAADQALYRAKSEGRNRVCEAKLEP